MTLAFTGQLGNPNASLGNVELGAVAETAAAASSGELRHRPRYSSQSKDDYLGRTIRKDPRERYGGMSR